MSVFISNATDVRATNVLTRAKNKKESKAEQQKRLKEEERKTEAEHTIYVPAAPYVCNTQKAACSESYSDSDSNTMTKNFCEKQCTPSLIQNYDSMYESAREIAHNLKYLFRKNEIGVLEAVHLHVKKKDGTEGRARMEVSFLPDQLKCVLSGLDFTITYDKKYCGITISNYFFYSPYQPENFENLSAEEVFFLVDTLAMGFCNSRGSTDLHIELSDSHAIKKSFSVAHLPSEVFQIVLYSKIINFLNTGADFYDNKGFKKERADAEFISSLLNAKLHDFMKSRNIFLNGASELTVGSVIRDLYVDKYDSLLKKMAAFIQVGSIDDLTADKIHEILQFLKILQEKIANKILISSDAKRVFEPFHKSDLVELVHFQSVDMELETEQKKSIVNNVIDAGGVSKVIAMLDRFKLYPVPRDIAINSVSKGDKEFLLALLTRGARPEHCIIGAIIADNIALGTYLIDENEETFKYMGDRLLTKSLESHSLAFTRLILKKNNFILSSDINFFTIAIAGEPSTRRTDVVRILLSFAFENPDRMDPGMNTYEAIISALEANDPDIMRLFLEFAQKDTRVDPGFQNNILLRKAVREDKNEIVRILLEFSEIDERINPADKDNYAIKQSVKNNNTAIVRMFLELSETDDRVSPNDDSFYLLKNAIINDFADIVQLFLDDFVKRPHEHPRKYMKNLLYLASSYGHKEILLKLLAFTRDDPRADPATKNNYILIKAVEDDHIEVVRVLLNMSKQNKKIDPAADDHSALKKALKLPKLDILRALLEFSKVDKRIDPGFEDNYLLRTAVQNNKLEALRVLLTFARSDSRIQPSVQNNILFTKAAGNGGIEILRELLEYCRRYQESANPGDNDNIALRTAVENDQLETTRLLLEYAQEDRRVDPGSEDNFLMLAAIENNQKEMIHLLLEFSKIDSRINPDTEENYTIRDELFF